MKNYLDKFWFRLLLVLIASIYITELGSIDSYANRLRTADFYKEYSATALIGLVVFELVYFINSKLDRKKPWHGQVFHRLLLQAIFGWIAPLFVVFGLATLYFLAYNVDIMRTDYLYYAFPFVVLLLLFLNIVIVMTPYCLIGFQHNKLALSSDNDNEMLLRIKVHDGNSLILLEPNEIAAAYIVSGRVVIKDKSDKEYLSDLTLDELEKEYLPEERFFRINRQLIASAAVCKSYSLLEFGKLEVGLSINVPVNPVVSQLKAKHFREWME